MIFVQCGSHEGLLSISKPFDSWRYRNRFGAEFKVWQWTNERLFGNKHYLSFSTVGVNLKAISSGVGVYLVK